MNYKRSFIILVSVLFICFKGYAENYYVSKSGNDQNAGSETNPWMTVQHGVNQIGSGDTIFVRAGIYNELVTFGKSGDVSGGYITLQNYPNETTILDGEGLEETVLDAGLIKISNQSYIRVIGFEIRNLKTSSGSRFPAGIWVNGTSHHIELKNNLVHHIEQNIASGRGGAHGIAVYGTSSNSSLHDILIEGNEVRDCKLGWSESLVLNGNVEKFVIKNNRVHDNNNIAFDFIGHEGECSNPALDQVRDGLVVGNVAYNIESRLNAAYGPNDPCADGFYVDGGKNIIFEQNVVCQCNIGFEIASEHGGKTTSGIIMRNNYIYNNHVLGLAIGGYDQNRGNASDCTIVNNTFYMNDADNLGWGVEILVQYYCVNNLFQNNIIYGKTTTPLISHTSGTGSNNVFNYNLYYTAANGVWRWNGSQYTTLATFQSGSDQDSHSEFADPLLTDPATGNIQIQTDSPAIDQGQNMDAEVMGTQDYYGNPRIINNQVDMGACEYGGTMVGVQQSDRMDVGAETFVLFQNYPNPFNPSTSIKYNLKQANHVKLDIYNILGERVDTLVDQYQENGSYSYHWEPVDKAGNSLPGAVYVCMLNTGSSQQTIKMLVLN